MPSAPEVHANDLGAGPKSLVEQVTVARTHDHEVETVRSQRTRQIQNEGSSSSRPAISDDMENRPSSGSTL
jgi:hypothetical protein